MKKYIKYVKNIAVFAFFAIIFICLISNSKAVGDSVKKGILLCYNVIIPALFPFLVLTLLISKSGILLALPFPEKSKYFLKYLGIFILSLIGGYPIGAKLISEACDNNLIDKRDAGLLLFSSVNSGPAFIVLAVGGGILGSTKQGWLLYLAQATSSMIIFLIIFPTLSKKYIPYEKKISLSDSFVLAVSDASVSMLSMSGFIIICSVMIEILEKTALPALIKRVLFLTVEISNAVLETKNIYLLCFILSFGSLSIIFQVLFISKSFKPNIIKILISRILNAILSTTILFILLKTFSVSTDVLSNMSSPLILNQNNSLIISSMLLLTCVAFIYSLNSKKICGKFSIDIF